MVMQRAPRLVRSLGLPLVFALAAIAVAASGGMTARADSPAGPANATASEFTGPQFSYPIGGTTGWDISWPQCDNGERPQGAMNFSIIGVNGGKMFTTNKCLKEMFSWANNGRTLPQVYVNTSGLPDGWTSPLCAKTDLPCNAYNYGYEGAAFAHRYAKSQGVDPQYWWLDVETGNYWTADHFLNERVIAGAIEYLQETGHTLGLYSTPRQWGIIAGGYAPRLMNWTAGAADLAEATARCTPKYAFGGGTVVLVQYVSEHFDTSYICPNTGVGKRATMPILASGR